MAAASEAVRSGQERAEADTGGQGKFSEDRRSDRPERRRALRPGEMVNDFRDKVNWREYYAKIAQDEYNPDFFEDGETAIVELSGGTAIVEMQRNGEWQVIRYGGIYDERRTQGRDGVSEISEERNYDGSRSGEAFREPGRTDSRNAGKGSTGLSSERNREGGAARDSETSGDGLRVDDLSEMPEEARSLEVNDGKFSREMDSRRTPEADAITAGMSENERYEILQRKSIVLRAAVDDSKLRTIRQKIDEYSESFDLLGTNEKKLLFRRIGEEFGVYKSYANPDVNLEFFFSRKNMRESTRKQGKNYQDFAKLFSCFDDVISSAVGVEVNNRNEEGYKPDPTLESVYVMFSAFEDGDTIVPVKLEVKEFSDKKNSLYVAVTLGGIKKDEVVTLGNTETGVTRSARSSEIRLSDLFGKVNKNDTSFLKYVPKQFLAPSSGTDGGMEGKLSRDLPGETAELQDEYDKLKERLSYWKGQVKRTERFTLREADTKRLAKSILSDYSSKTDADSTYQRIKELGEHILNGEKDEEGSVTWVGVHDEAVRIARDIIQNASALVDDGERDTYQQIKDYFRGRRIRVTNAKNSINDNNYVKAEKRTVSDGGR